MKRLLNAASALAIVSIAYPVSAAEFSFLQEGWSGNGVLQGTFTGEDLNNDGQINSFDNEVISFSAGYQSSEIEFLQFSSLDALPFGGDFPVRDDAPLTGLVFTLDGTGQLGDDTSGSLEGLSVFGGGFGPEVFLAVGPGPFNQCDGTAICGGIFNAFDFAEQIFEVNTIAAPVDFQLQTTMQLSQQEPMRMVEPPIIIQPPIDESNGPLLIERAIATNTTAITVMGDDLGDPEGFFESTPILPDSNDGNGFVFNLEDIRNLPGRIFFIDPEIATGYTYEITGDLFFSVQAPSLNAVNDGDGEYTLSYTQGGTDFTRTLQAGEIFEFGPDGVTGFEITGIDPLLMLDPTNANAFVTGVSVVDGGIPGTITQTPITTDVNAVPLPASGVLLLSGIAGFAFMRRRREALRG